MLKILGYRLKIARENKNLTQMEVAKKLGISNGTLSGYERNYRDPDTETLAKLAELYGVSVDWLTGITDTPQTHDEVRESEVEYNIQKISDFYRKLASKYNIDIDNENNRRKLEQLIRLFFEEYNKE